MSDTLNFQNSLPKYLSDFDKPYQIVREKGKYLLSEDLNSNQIGHLPSITPKSLGDPTFNHQYNTRFAYYAGAMANGISSEELVMDLERRKQ